MTTAVHNEDLQEDLKVNDEVSYDEMSLEDLFASLESIEDVVNDVEDEHSPATELEPAIESLMDVVNEIRQSGGISRSDAATLSNMTASIEGFQDTFKNLPLNSFTETPSKVNYDVSMENIVANVIKKIIEAIKRAIAWIRDKLRDVWKWITGSNVKSKQAEVATARVVAEVKSLPVPNEKQLEETVKLVTVEDVDEFMLGSGGKKTVGKTGRVATKLDEKVVTEAKKAPDKKPDAILNVLFSRMVEDLQRRVTMVQIDMMRTDLTKRVFEFGDVVASQVTAHVNNRGSNIVEVVKAIEAAAEKLARKSLGPSVLADRPADPDDDMLDKLGSDLKNKVLEATQQRTYAAIVVPDLALELVSEMAVYIVRHGEAIHAQRKKTMAALEKAIQVLDKDISRVQRTVNALSAKVKTVEDEASHELIQVQRLLNYYKSYLLQILMRTSHIVQSMSTEVGKMSATVNQWHGAAE